MPTMKINEEKLAFRCELGSAIGQWGHVEHHVRNIALLCVSPPDREALAITFHSIENFRSKLAVCDNLVIHRFGKSPHFDKWTAAKKELTSLSAKRNKLVHGWHKLYVHNKVGRRFAIIPLHHADGSLLHVDGERPPGGAICLRELAGITREFHALTTQVCNVYYLLADGRAPLPESLEQPEGPPTIQRISFLIRAEYGLQFLASPKKSEST